MRPSILVTSAYLAFAFTSARAEQNTYAALERLGEIAAQIDTAYCPSDSMRAFDGALSGINAARTGAPPIAMQTRDADGFADAFSRALANDADFSAIERAAVDGLIHMFDPSNLFIPSADAHRVREETQSQPAVTWRVAGGAAIVSIATFSETSADDVQNALRAIQRTAPRPRGYILDLRDNQGGLLDQVVAVADHFIDGGAVMITRPFGECADDVAETYNARRDDVTNAARLIVLVNENTASGAELLAAILRERRGAVLVGQTTHGNANLHTVVPVNGGRDGFLKLRTGTLTTASGATWDQIGLIPDVETAVGDLTLERATALLTDQ